MQNKRVTCIMTVYKKYTYIYRALDSILCQLYQDIELIVCDDCSGDFPQEKILNYIENNKKDNLKNIIVYSNEKNLGTVKNFNRAIQKASGYYFISLSSDDIFYDKSVMDKVVKKFEETGAIYATCRAVMETNDNRNGLCFQTEKDIKDIIKMNPKELYNRIAKDNIVLGASTYFTLEVIKKYGYFDEKYIYIEDISRFLSLCRKGEKIDFFDIVAVRHTMDGISNTKKVPKKYLQDNLNICKHEILKYRIQLSLFSYRYNLCRKKSLEYRISSDGEMPYRKKIWLFIKYPDASIYNVLVTMRRRFAKRTRLD